MISACDLSQSLNGSRYSSRSSTATEISSKEQSDKQEVRLMDISEIEKRLLELDKELHSLMKAVREAKKPRGAVRSAAGAWGYDVDSVEFTRELRRTRRAGL